MMKILLYCWKSLCEQMAVRAMSNLGLTVIKLEDEIKDYHADAIFSQKCFNIIHHENIDAIFSYDYFPILSMVAQVTKIPYISWIFDCPMYTLYSKTLSNDFNHIFCFDHVYAKRLEALGGKHIYPFVLGTDLSMLDRALVNKADDRNYACDISFVGSLYNEDTRHLKTELFDGYTGGFLEGIMEAQSKLYGCNIIRDVLTEQAVKEITEICGLSMGELYRYDSRGLAADVLNRELTGRERLAVVDKISSIRNMDIYTASELPQALKDRKQLHAKGYIDYDRQMPLVFNQSRINLNITARTIESGISQRVMDILACGGFCLSNYQSETAKWLQNGTEIVMYESMEDLLYKIEYYLSHEDERSAIAANGKIRAEEIFDIEYKIRDSLSKVQEIHFTL